MSAHLSVATQPLPVAEARCGALVMDHGAEPVDGKWHATDESERTALAHLRGWVHFGPRCPICQETRRAVAHAKGEAVPPWAS
jgi:hypothetical protein